jgi:NitT/TauT family transport system ATP-binding protein
LQAFPLLHWLTVRQNLKLACRIRGVSPSQADEILLQLSASHLADLYPKQLSGGERCRASIAESVVGSPKLLLLDEPFTGLDLLVKEEVAQAMFNFAARNSISVILVTHDLEDATRFSDRVIVLGKNPITQIVADIPTARPNAAAAVEAALREHA